MRFLVDVDGVVADLVAGVLEILNKRFRKNYHHYNITDFYFFDPAKKILTPGECHFAKNFLSRPGFVYRMQAYPGSEDYMNMIRDAGHEVVFVTAHWNASESWTYDRTLWLEEMVGAKASDVIFAHRKELIQGDVLIDDHYKNCEDYAAANPNAKVLMYDRPWNKHHKIKAPNIQRFDFTQLEDFLKSISN